MREPGARVVSRRASWALLAAVLVVALAVGAGGRSGPPTEDERVRRITAQVRCPTCRGLSVADSDAPAAVAIRDEVRRQVQEGRSDGEVVRFLVDRFTADIRLEPEARGVGILVWALPLLVVGGVVVGLGVVVRRRRARPGGRASDADRELVRRAMGPS